MTLFEGGRRRVLHHPAQRPVGRWPVVRVYEVVLVLERGGKAGDMYNLGPSGDRRIDGRRKRGHRCAYWDDPRAGEHTRYTDTVVLGSNDRCHTLTVRGAKRCAVPRWRIGVRSTLDQIEAGLVAVDQIGMTLRSGILVDHRHLHVARCVGEEGGVLLALENLPHIPLEPRVGVGRRGRPVQQGEGWVVVRGDACLEPRRGRHRARGAVHCRCGVNRTCQQQDSGGQESRHPRSHALVLPPRPD